MRNAVVIGCAMFACDLSSAPAAQPPRTVPTRPAALASQDLQLKDAVTIAVSVAAALISTTFAVINIALQQSKWKEEYQEAFSEAVLGISDVRKDLADLRRELGPKFDDAANIPNRIRLADRMNFHIEKALYFYKVKRVEGLPHEHVMLAAAMIDGGRISEAVPHYKLSVDKAPDDYSRAMGRRVYGRALIFGGDYEGGRASMLSAANWFTSKAESGDFESGHVLYEAADTFRRLIEAGRAVGITRCEPEDMSCLRTIEHRLGASRRGDMVGRMIADLKAGTPGRSPASQGTEESLGWRPAAQS